MSFNWEKSIEERMSEYTRLSEIGGEYYYNAIENLVEIHHCLPFLDAKSRAKWRKRLKQIHLSEEPLKIVEHGVDSDIKYIERVLSIGTIWNDDEISYVLQRRILVDMVLEYFREAIGREILLDHSNADKLIISIAQSRKNKRSFEIAVRQIKKNWGLPIRSKWLDMELYINKGKSG
ncbi:MAG: hypothetical protein L0220_24945 [Acidobacteria bacterium]|nr:hypothetical protein [Acidobacteriota bacterium]